MAGCEDGGHGFLGHLNDIAPGAHRELCLGGLSCCDCKKGASPKKGTSEAHCCWSIEKLPAPEFYHLGQGYGALDLWSDNALPVSHGGQKTSFSCP